MPDLPTLTVKRLMDEADICARTAVRHYPSNHHHQEYLDRAAGLRALAKKICHEHEIAWVDAQKLISMQTIQA